MTDKLSPFDIANAINQKTGHLNADQVDYQPYMMNRIFSNTKDTVLFANEMNMRWGNLDKQQQFDFYYYALPKKKRYGKWHKNQDDKDYLDTVKEVFGYSRRKAKDVESLLRPHLNDLKELSNKGGRNANQRRNPG